MPTHQISVTVDGNAIRVSPDSLAMTSADQVHWRGTNSRAFSIRFETDGPFGAQHLPHSRATTLQKPTKRGRFKYTVISDENPSVILDPEIIIHDPPTTPGP